MDELSHCHTGRGSYIFDYCGTCLCTFIRKIQEKERWTGKEKETGVRWELPESEEEPCLMTGGSESREIHQTKGRKQNTEVLSEEKSVQEMAKIQSNGQDLSHLAEENVGATTLLWKGEDEYQPHLTLISMNPRERNSIVLVKMTVI